MESDLPAKNEFLNTRPLRRRDVTACLRSPRAGRGGQGVVATFKLTLAYDGTAYGGWQVQPNARTIQAELETAFATIVGAPVRTVASGRTDAGVHALGQVVSVDCDTRLDLETLCRALNANLPRDIAVLAVEFAAPGFHAIRDAVRKRYRYVIQDGPPRDVFLRAYSWQLPQPLDVPAMQRAAEPLVGTHDFASFETSGSERVTSVRTILDLPVQRRAGAMRDQILIEVEADGFLYNMVRNIVGTLVEVGRGKQPPDWVAEVLAAKDRTRAGMTAPPHGLFLVHVHYDSELVAPGGDSHNGAPCGSPTSSHA
jgi:tRNA pseudouridine38-40 synthase